MKVAYSSFLLLCLEGCLALYPSPQYDSIVVSTKLRSPPKPVLEYGVPSQEYGLPLVKIPSTTYGVPIKTIDADFSGLVIESQSGLPHPLVPSTSYGVPVQKVLVYKKPLAKIQENIKSKTDIYYGLPFKNAVAFNKLTFNTDLTGEEIEEVPQKPSLVYGLPKPQVPATTYGLPVVAKKYTQVVIPQTLNLEYGVPTI